MNSPMTATVNVYETTTGDQFHTVTQTQPCGCSSRRTTAPDGRHRYAGIVRCPNHT